MKLSCALLFSVLLGFANAEVKLNKIGALAPRVDALEIVTFTQTKNVVFATYSDEDDITMEKSAGVIAMDISEPRRPTVIGKFETLSTWGSPSSVAYSKVEDTLAIAVIANEAPKQGTVLVVHDVAKWISCSFCNTEVTQYTSGFHPDMVTFSPDGKYILVADEGEPVDYFGGGDPVGSVTILTKEGGRFRNWCQAGFEGYNWMKDSLLSQGVRVFGPGASVAQDLEPEYITVSADSMTAYVSLQENNALAVVDIPACVITAIVPLGYKSWGNMMFDASDKDDAVNLQAWPTVYGMYQPDGIASVEIDGATYIISANEGDGREYGEEGTPNFYADEIRVADLAKDEGFSNITYPKYFDETELGRLKVTIEVPYTNDAMELFTYGARSVSIWSDAGELVWDSGNFIEKWISERLPAIHNSEGIDITGATLEFDDRSDAKGPEPEHVEIGIIGDVPYMFVALERVGGIMVWDISDPTAPVFQSYKNTWGDLAPESSKFISANDSPTGEPLLAVVYEVSGSLSIFAITME